MNIRELTSGNKCSRIDGREGSELSKNIEKENQRQKEDEEEVENTLESEGRSLVRRVLSDVASYCLACVLLPFLCFHLGHFYLFFSSFHSIFY